MTVGTSLLAIRPGERRTVVLLAGLFATLEAGRGLGEVTADTLFLSRFGAGPLPYLYVVLGPVSLAVALGYGAGIGRAGQRRFLVALQLGFVALLVVGRLALLTGSDAVLAVLWLGVYAMIAVLLTVVWTVAGVTLDMRQARRLFPICTSAAIVGGFVAVLLAGPLAHLIGTDNLLLVVAALLGAATWLTAASLDSAGRRPRRTRSATSFRAELSAGYTYVRGSPLMRAVAVAYLLFAVLLFSISYPFLGAMSSAFGSEAELATALGLLSGAVTGASFLVSISVANRLYARIGVCGAAVALPLVYLAGFGLWLVQFSLATAVIVRFSQQVTQRGVSNAAWSAMYNVVPAERRPQVLAFMDGVPGQIGITLSGILLLVGAALLAPTQLFAIGLMAAIVATWVVLRVRARYGRALVATLRSGLGEQVLEGGPGLAALSREPAVLPGLERALSAPSAGSRRLAAFLIGRLGTPEAAGSLVAHLDDADAEVRQSVVSAIAVLDARRVVPHADRLAGDPSPAVRAELAIALTRAGQPAMARRAMDQLLAATDPDDRIAGLGALARLDGVGPIEPALDAVKDPDPRVRLAGVRALDELPEPDGVFWQALVGRLDDDDPLVRRASVAALAGRPEATAALLTMLHDGTERAQESAVVALGGDVHEAGDEIRGWALGQLERAILLRRRAISCSAPRGASEEFLSFLLELREREIEDRLLAAIAALGAPDADGSIRRALRSSDPEARAQAIEAIDALGDRQLGRAVVRLLDSDEQPREPTEDAIRAMIDDPDPWIRILGLCAWRDRHPDEWPMMAQRLRAAGDDAARLVLEAFDGRGGGHMPDTERTLGEIERMLALRRVPLFAELAPEDLQRIAATAIERLYLPDEALVLEGDLDDELIVLVEGEVLVVKTEGDDARLIRTYEAGDHIGELAVIRSQPRAATVISGATGVRGLVIGGDALRAILRERPEAAMAMLATLADRISLQ